VQHPNAILGNIAHAFFESVTTPGAPRDDAGLDRAWGAAVDALQRRAEHDSDERDWVPFAESIRGLERTRLRAIRHATALPSGISGSPSPSESGNQRRLGAEVRVSVPAPPTTLRGSIDLVFELDGLLHIVDWKTGSVLDQQTGKVKAEYQDQLNLYAGMYGEAFGRFPDRLELRPFVGPAIAWNSSREESGKLLAMARERAARLHLVRQAIISNLAGFEVIEATPDQNGNCSECRARPHCSAYLGHVLSAQAPAARLGDETWSRFDLQGIADKPIRCNGVITVPITANERTVYLRYPDSTELREAIDAGTPVRAFGAKNSSRPSEDDAAAPAEFVLPRTGRITVGA
jgi:hypothetical protein